MSRLMLIITFIILNNFINAQNEIYLKLTPNQCDSLIKVNWSNPDFVILDVRTSQEYIPEHLKGAINRNYYDANFDELLDTLDKQKKYLLHCLSGGRSAKALDKMKIKVFKEVYEMEGGIKAWKNDSLFTTMEFAPRIVLASDSIIEDINVLIGEIDTISITITNRENDTLKFNSISEFDDDHFSTDFDIDTTLLGADDYTFNIFHEPFEESEDSLVFVIESNGGNVQIIIERTDYMISKSSNELISDIEIFPNPTSDFLKLSGLDNDFYLFEILNINGKTVYSKTNISNDKVIDLSSVSNGVYLVKISNKKSLVFKKLIINNN